MRQTTGIWIGTGIRSDPSIDADPSHQGSGQPRLVRPRMPENSEGRMLGWDFGKRSTSHGSRWDLAARKVRLPQSGQLPRV